MAKTNSLKRAPYQRRFRHENGQKIHIGFQLMEYAGYAPDGIDWRPNVPFRATLELRGYERGRSAARSIWYDQTTNTEYPMFMTSMVELAMESTIVQGRTNFLEWIVVKRGQNYGIEKYEA
jgi:hypothetical protein